MTSMSTRKRILIASSVLAALVLLAIPAYYEPLMFHYAIWRFESAATPAQERAACILVSRVGHVWKVNEIHQNEFQGLPSRVKPGTNDVVTQIEWWESPWWIEKWQPYRAYHVLLDPKNRELLIVKPK